MAHDILTEQNSNKIPVEHTILTLWILMILTMIFLRSPWRWLAFFILFVLAASLDKGLPVIQSPLMVAIKKGDINQVKSVIDKGVDIKTKNSALERALTYDHLDIAQLLLDRGADINTRYGQGQTLLMYISTYKEAQFAIDKGAEINARDDNGNTALMDAAHSGHADVVRLLLDKGADINARGYNGNTALIYVRDANVIQILIKKGIDLGSGPFNFG